MYYPLFQFCSFYPLALLEDSSTFALSTDGSAALI